MTILHYTPLIALADLPDGMVKAMEVGGRSIMLCRFEGRVHALDNLCTHAEEPLACGRMRLGWIACPAHGARFDLETGEPLTGPATKPVATYAVRIVDGMIEVAL
ncbi:non-heme iron oxygenase ferredoxin subunit [Sphingobium sp. BYY-5]|uniref:Rieske (2Fe-2S) protein n=1 Tax=Sphingobium sp. BYY-5 TaxID=2926400 RepID=UPI001FA705F7|nr:non-heme iron oxygenase ferredoxin subunit [Sphingobium sp. BYY-5]MCI4592009.1 non-heme iron oxygenase ferredoxin subunit [Sphingobium sp. BYY-5]